VHLRVGGRRRRRGRDQLPHGGVHGLGGGQQGLEPVALPQRPLQLHAQQRHLPWGHVKEIRSSPRQRRKLQGGK
jgi:hypothetical protein